MAWSDLGGGEARPGVPSTGWAVGAGGLRLATYAWDALPEVRMRGVFSPPLPPLNGHSPSWAARTGAACLQRRRAGEAG